MQVGSKLLDDTLEPGIPAWVCGANARYLAENLAGKRLQAVIDPAAPGRRERLSPTPFARPTHRSLRKRA